MNLYSKYLICYDIENNKTRTKFFEKMKDFGLQPIQKSVFYGFLNQAEYNSVRRFAFELLKLIIIGTSLILFLRIILENK